MSEFMATSAYAGVTISLVSYGLGAWLKKKFGFGFFNPLLISIIFTIIFLCTCGINYETYNEGALLFHYMKNLSFSKRMPRP